MRGIHHEVILIRHLAVEGHALLVSGHLFHSAHELVLGQEDRQRILGSRLADHVVFEFVRIRRQQTLKGFTQPFALFVGEFVFLVILLADQVLDRVAVDADEAQFFSFFTSHHCLLLRLRHHMHIEFAVHEQDIVAFRFRTLDISVMRIGIVGIEEDEIAVFVGLCLFDLRFVFLKSSILAVDILVKRKLFCLLVEFLVGQHPELDKHLDIIPFLGKLPLVGFV